jgi:hypothetical protein
VNVASALSFSPIAPLSPAAPAAATGGPRLFAALGAS